MSALINVRLPDKIDSILDNLANELHTTQTILIKDAILERIEDYLDSRIIDEIVSKNEPTLSHEDLKRELGI